MQCDLPEQTGLASGVLSAYGAAELTYRALHAGVAEKIALSALAAVPAGVLGFLLVPAMMFSAFYALPWIIRRTLRPNLPRGLAPWHLATLLRAMKTEGVSFDHPVDSES